MADKKPDFVVSDRRKFTEEGDLRTDVRDEAPAKSSQPTEAAAVPEQLPPPPTHAEQEAQHDEYRASNKKLDDMLAAGGHGKAEDFEMSFERLVQSLYVTAMLQLGLMRHEGENPQERGDAVEEESECRLRCRIGDAREVRVGANGH